MDEVERLLQHPEDLKRLPNMLEEYTQKHQANKAQLSATVASQVDAARSGMELLESAQKTLAKMQQCYNVRAYFLSLSASCLSSALPDVQLMSDLKPLDGPSNAAIRIAD